MSEEQLVNLIKEQLDGDVEESSERERDKKTANKGNVVFAQNVGIPVYEYLDTVYLERIKTYVEEIYEERIKKLEQAVEDLKKKVK